MRWSRHEPPGGMRVIAEAMRRAWPSSSSLLPHSPSTHPTPRTHTHHRAAAPPGGQGQGASGGGHSASLSTRQIFLSSSSGPTAKQQPPRGAYRHGECVSPSTHPPTYPQHPPPTHPLTYTTPTVDFWQPGGRAPGPREHQIEWVRQPPQERNEQWQGTCFEWRRKRRRRRRRIIIEGWSCIGGLL